MTTNHTPILKPMAAALVALLVSITCLRAQQAGDSPVKIFILAGQSNMEGQGEITPVTTPGTLEYTVANDPAGDYQYLVDGLGDWIVRDDVWIRDESPAQGELTVGWGASATLIGPELAFGHFIGDLNEQQVLIVKAAWGGKSLAVDFRPPSSGWSGGPPVADGDEGFYYTEILRLVNEAKDNVSTYFPDYTGGTPVIAGICWHQGWNDRIDAGRSAEYETNMANFINDIRSGTEGLGIPDLPFVIATSGMDGGPNYQVIEQAQLAMADATAYPAFAGNVAVVDTRTTYEGLDFWQPAELSPANELFHWNRNARTYLHIGQSMADAMSILAPGRCPFRLRAQGGPSGVTLTWENGTETPTSVRILRNGTEIAAAAAADPPTFLDASAQPGVLDYEIQFTMPGDACAPLATSFDGGITGLTVTPGAGGLTLDWTNAMGYAAIEIRRNGDILDAALPGTDTTYTDTAPPTSGLITYTVAPTTGTSTPASVVINLNLESELGILDPTLTNGGINPATGEPWAEGDRYRLIFVSSATTTATSTDIATYNAFVQGLANTADLGSSALGPVTWKAVGSTATVDARDNLDANPNTDGEGEPILLMDGSTIIATSYADLWNGITVTILGAGDPATDPARGIYFDENGDNVSPPGSADDRVFTGTVGNGTASGQPLGTVGNVSTGSTGSNFPAQAWGLSGTESTRWTQDFSFDGTQPQEMYGLSRVLTIIDTTPDGTPPTLLSIEDDLGGGDVFEGSPVTYTVTFSEPMDAGTVGTEDFDNAASASLTVDSVTATGDPAVFTVVVTPTGAGDLQLRIAGGASLEDVAGNLLDAGAAVPDDTIITVNADLTPPAVLSFTDDLGGSDVFVGSPVTYTVTFSEPMNPGTVGTGDFDNVGSAAVTIDSVVATGNPAAFTVVVTPTGPGGLQLQIAGGATLEDVAGNLLDAGSAAPDDTTITVIVPPAVLGQFGILDVAGINPATGTAWAPGDTYRLIFVTSTTTDATSTDIATYNAFVQGVADAAGLDGVSWKAVGSTATVDARDNTGTNPSVDGVGEPIVLMDGATVIADNYDDLWDGIKVTILGAGDPANDDARGIYFDENGDNFSPPGSADDRVFTGTVGNGTASGQPLGTSGNVSTGSTGSNFPAQFWGLNGSGDSTRWTQDFSFDGTQQQEMYAISEPLTVVSGASAPVITSITKVAGMADLYELTLMANPLTAYEFRSSPTLPINPGTRVGGLTDGVPAMGTIGGPNNTLLTTDANGDGLVRMTLTGAVNFVLAQVPPPLLSENFEAGDGGFTVENKGTGTNWTHGEPNSPNQGGGGVEGGNGGAGDAWGTELTGGYGPDTNACLRSTVIDLTAVSGAELSFALSIDANVGHTYRVDVIEAATDTVIAPLIAATEDADVANSPWELVGPTALPAAAIGQEIRIQWTFVGNGDTNYNGVYIDDVLVEETNP